MSHKFGIVGHSAFILGLLVSLLSMSSCDPCRQLAQRICDCRETEEEKRQCASELSLATQHEYFTKAKEPGVCEEALKKCYCIDFNNDQDAECGMYRLSIK